MSKFSVLVICLLLPGCAALPAESSASPAIVKDWDVPLGFAPDGPFFLRGAVCPDGTYFFSDGLGKVIRLLSDGRIGNESEFADFTPIAITCDGNSRLLGVPKNNLVTIAADESGALTIASSLPLDESLSSATAIVAVGSSSLGLLSLRGSAAHINLVDRAGRVSASFETPFQQAPWSISTVLNGSLTFDPLNGNVLVVPENPFTFLRYRPSLNTIDTIPRNDSAFAPPESADSTARGDRVVRAVYLNDGRLLVQVIKRSSVFSPAIGANVRRSSTYVELFDPSLNLLATGISVSGLGQLQGASHDGGIYFQASSPQGGIHVIRAHLSN